MNQLTAPLVADHRHCDRLFATAEDAAQRSDWVACREHFNAFRAAMLHHFEVEESVLFPAFEQATGMSMGPTAMILKTAVASMCNASRAAEIVAQAS